MQKLSFLNLRLHPKWTSIYLFLCLVLLPIVVFFLFSKPWPTNYDFWETAATVRESSVNILHPSHPHLMLPGHTSPRFVPYTLFWGFFKRVTHLGIFTTMVIAGLINYFIFIIGLYQFVSKQFKNDSLPTYALLTLLLVWGSGINWASAYHLEFFLLSLSYVGFFAFGVSLYALYYLNRYCEENRWHTLLFYSLLSVITFVTHPHTGAFCFVAALALLLAYGNLRRALFLQGVPLLALGACLIWPYFSYWDLFFKAKKIVFYPWLYHNQIRVLGPAILGFPIVIFYALKRKYLFLLYGLLFCSFIYVVSGFMGILLGGRFFLFAAFFLHLAIALYVKQNDVFNIQKIKDSFRTDGLVMVLIFMLLIPSGIYRAREMGRHIRRLVDKPLKFHSYDSPVKPYLFLSEHLSYPDVVLVNPHEGWVIPAITGARVVAKIHISPLILDEANQRKKDVASFFKGRLSLEERLSLITKYQATHIMINLKNEKDWDPSFIKDLEIIGEEKARSGEVVLYKVIMK